MQHLRRLAHTWLRRSESVFKTDMVYLAKSGFWITLGQTVSSLMSLGLAIVFANLLPKEIYGSYRYILSIVGVLGIFTLTGMNSAVSRSVAAGHEGALKISVRYQLKWNLLMSAALLGLGGYYWFHGNTSFGASFIILGFFVPSTLALNTYGAYLEGRKEFRFASVASICSSLLYVVGALVAVLVKGDTVWLIVAYTLATFFSTLLFYIFTLKKFPPTTDDSGEVLAYGRELTFIGFIAPIASQIDKIILAHFWGATSLAVYSLAQAVPDRVTSLIKDWLGIGVPKFTNKTFAELDTMFYTRIFQGLGIGVISTVIYWFTAPYLFTYLLPQYIDAILYSQILALGFLFAVPNRFVSTLLVAQKLSKAILVNSIIQNTLKTAVYIVLGFFGGIMGLVLANVLNACLGMIINIVVWKTSKA